MPDNKEKLITAENQGKGVTPTAGSKMLIRPAADPIKIAPAPPKLDKNGNPVIPPYDATGKSFNEIADYYNSVEASRIDPSAVQEAGYDPYKQYEALGDESAFYAGGDWAKQASDQQGFGQQAKNAIVGGTLNGVVKAVEALSFIPNILTRDWEKSAFQESLAQAQQDINQALPVYSDPNNPLSMDSSMFWGGVKGVIESGLQFALPGKVISSGLGAISKGLSASSRALLGSEALALEATGASALGRSGAAGIEAVAARSSNGVTALLEGMIQNPAQRAALVEWAKSVPAGIIQNQLEGTIMGFEVYNAREQELRDAGITDEKYIKEEASAAANQMRNQNMLLIAKDMWEMKTIFGKPNKAVQSITDKSRWGFRPSDLKIWKKDVWQQAWKGGSNPFMLAVGEAGEEMFQAGLEGNIQNQARIRENLENAENPNYTPMDVDKTANVLSYMFTDQSIFEGMMGFFGGGFQNALVQIPGKIIDNRRYNKLNTELTAVNEAIEAEPDEQKKEVLRTQAAQIKSDIEGTLKGNYKAQQARITENEELIKDKFENLFDAHELHEAAVFDNDTVTRELIEDNMFVKAAMDNLKKGTLGAFRESLKEIEQGTDQAKTMVDGDITPEIQAKAKKMQERLTSIETEWNRHRDPQLGERKFFVGENKRNIGRAIENNNKKLDDNKARVNKDIAEYNKSQKAVNPDHVDIPSVDDINNPDSVTETEGVKSLSFDKEKANNFLKDAELQKSLNIASNLNKLQQENAIEEAYLNSAQYRKWKDKINTFISKNADKLNSSKLTELADEINNIDKKVNERTRFDGVSKKEVTGDTSKERQENRKDLKQAINEAAKKDLLKQINFLKDKIKVLEAVKELESLEKIREDSDKQKEVDLLGPFMQKAIDGNGYFHYTTNAGVKNYAHITNVSGLEQGDEIEYLVNGKTSATVSYFSELDEDGNITKLGFKDSFLQGNIKEATEEEYLQHIAEIKSKQPTTEKPVNDYNSPNNYNAYLNPQDPIGAAIGTYNPLPSPEVEWDIDPIVKREQKRLNDDVSVLIQNKIDLLIEEQTNVQSDISDVNKLVKSLSAQLTSKTKLSGIEVDRIQKQIQTLLNIVNSNSKKNSKKGLSTLNRSDDLKLNIRAEFKTLNELFSSIKELKKYVYQLRTIRKDLNNQINYYNSLLNDHITTGVTTNQLIDRRTKISNKISIIDRLIKILNDALSKSIKYIKSYVDSIKTSFKNLKSNDLKGLLNESLDKSLITNYNEVNNEFKQLESQLYEHLDNLDFLEENKKNEERRLDELNNKLTQLTNQFRYIDELINEIPIDNSPVPEIELPSDIPPAPVQTEIIIPEEVPVITEEKQKLEIINNENQEDPIYEIEEEPEEELITNNPIPVNEDNNPVGDTTPDTTLDPIDDTEIGNTPPQKVVWESNKLTEPSGVVSYSSRECVKDSNGKVRNKSNVRVLKPIDTQEYVVGTTGYFKVKPEDLSGPIESTPIEIILGNDKNNINSAYIPTLASLLSTEGSDMPGYFSEEDLSKSDESNRYLVLSNKGQEIVELIKQYDVNPTKEIFDRITDLIAAPFLANNITDLNPFTRIVTVNKESESKSRDFSIATTELIKLYKNRKQVISDINSGVKNPPTKIVSITGGNISLMVSNATETSPNTNVTPLRKFIKDTKVRIEKVNGLNKLYIPMKRELEGVANEQPFNIIVNPVNKELVHALFEDYLTQGEVTLGWDEKSIAQLLNTIWNYDYEGSYIELELDKAGSRRQIAFRKAGDKNNENTVFLQRKDLVENKLTEEQKDKINSYIGSSIVPVLSLDLGIKKKNIRSVKLVNGEIKEYKTSNRSLLLDNASTNILYTKGPNGEYIFHEQATYQLDYGLQIDEQIIEDNADVINNNEWTAFVDNGIVSDKILNDIANNIINNIPLSSRQISVFSDHTKGTSGISPSTRIENRLVELKNNISNTESQVQLSNSTTEDIERRRQEELKKFETSEVKTEFYNIPVFLDSNAKVRGDKQEYISREVFDLAYANDNREGTGFQTAETLIRRGGYTKGELTKGPQALLKPEIDKINAKYDAKYVDAVKKGEMTQEQAMQALEDAGRKDSSAYAELVELNNTQTENVLDTNNNKPIGLEEDDFSIATSEEYNSIVVDEDKNQELLNSYTINYPGMTYALQDDFINDFAARIIRRFIGSETSAPIINIKENLASVKQWYVTKFIPKQTNPLYQNMFEYYDQLENLALEKVVSMGLKIPGKSKRDLTSNEAEIGDFSGENGKAIERYDDSIFEMNDYDKASFRLKSKLSLIRNGDTSTGFPAYIDVETTYGIIRQALANKPNMTLPEALTYLKELKNQSEIINLVVKEIEKWDLSAQNEFRTVFNLHKNKTGIMLWNTIDGTYSANIIDADRSSGGRITLAKWQSRLFDMVNNPYNNMVVSTMDQPLMFNVDKINNIRDQYTDLVNDYYEYEKQTKNKPNHQPYAEKLASMLNEIGIDISTQEMLNIMDSPLEYARIGEGYERKYIKHIFDSNVGVIGVLFSQIGNIALSKTTLIDGVHYISQEDYNPYVSGGSYYNNLSKYISYVRGNIDSESAYSASGNIKFAYTIPSPLTKIVDDIRNGKYDKGQAREELSAFSKSSELIADALFDLEHMDAIKEENGDFVESNDLKDIEQELDELAGIQNNGNKTRYAQTATNSDKSTMVKMSMSAKQESSEFTEDNIENNSSYLVKAVEAESERMRQANTLSVDKADDKTINGLTGNVQFDNGHKYFYFLPTANIQIAKVKLKELVTSLLPPEALDKPENFTVPLEEARQLYSERYIDYIGKEGGFEEYIADNYEDYTAQLNNPDLAFFMLMAYGDANANEATFNYTVDDFIEKIIATNYDILNPVSVDGVGIKFDTAIPKNDFGFVSLLAANMFNEELAYKLDKWQKYNIGYETKNSTGLGLDKQWLAKVNPDGKLTNDQVREIAAREMIFYSHVANLEYYQIVVGDPASFYKGPINTKLNDQTAEQVNQIIKDTNTEAIKRNAKNLAAGTIPSFEILRYNEEAKEWQPHSQKTYMSAVIKDNKKATINASIKANPKLAEMFKKMNIADAQEYTSFEEHLHVMFAKGTPELNFDLYKTLLVKARAQDRLKWNEKVPEQYKLSDKELKFIFGMMKPVQVSNIKFKSGASVYNTQLEVYIKSSALPLIHQVFGGMELAKLKESMFYEGEEARTRPIDRMAYESAFKGGALRIADVWDGEGNIKPDGLNNIYPIELERSGFYIQQEIPYDETKNKILIMSQMDKLFTEGYIQHDKTDVIGRKEIVKKAMFDAAKKSFMEKMGAVDNNGVLSFKDPKVIIEVLKNEAVARGFSKNVTDQLELVDGQLPPIFFGSGAQKYESVLASLVSGIILQKVHGHSYVQASSSGVVTMGDLSQDAKNDIVYVEGFDPSKDLPFITIDEESNSISAAGVFVPFQFLDKDKVKLDINKFIIEKDGKRYLDPEKVPSELLNLIGGRIPGQGHNSMLPIRILGFLPEYMGNTIVVPGEITVQMGSDFDVDKLYAYMWNYSYDEKNGKLRMYNQETSAKGRIKYEEYKKYKTQRDAIKEEIGAFINEYGITDNKKEILSTRESLDNVADNIRLLELVIEEYWGEELTEEDDANIQDLLGRIKGLEKDRAELIEQLNEFKDTKTTLDDYDGGKALLERKRALYTEYQNAVTERIDNLVIEKNIKTLQNEYYDLHWEVLTNPVMFERIAESLDMDDLANEFDVMKGLQKDSATGLMSPRFNRSSFRENKDGKRGVAVYANFIVLNSMIQNMGIKLDHKGEDLVIKIKSTSGLLKLDILGNDAKSEFTYKLTEEQKEKGVELKPKGERRIHKNLQNGQNESLDNAKYGRLGALNLNEDTFNAANALLMLSDSSKKGYHNSDSPQIGAVANDHVVALMTQPVIYDFIDNKALRFNQFSGNRFSRAGEAKLKSDIIRKYYELLYKKEEDEKIRIPSHMELIKNVTIPSVNDLTNARNLNLQTATKEQLKSYYTVQLNAFVGFLALDEVGQLLAGTQKAIDASTKGIGKSFIESLGKERLYKERIEGTDYDSSYFGIKLNGADQLADTEYGYAVREGVMFGNELFKSVFPYKQIYNTVTDYFRNQNRVLTEEEYRNVFNYYKTYIFANDKLFSQSIIDERDRLKYSEDNIFDRVIKYQNEDNEGNYLLKSIAVETDKRNPKERKLRFAAGKAQRQDEKLNTVALLRMDASSDPEIKRLANDLISYSFLTNPVQSANNFMMYVPSSIFQSNIMRQYLNEANQVMVNGNINYTDFMDQFIRHNPTYAPSRKMFGQPFTIKELESYATYSNDLEKLKIQYAKPGLTDKEKKAIGAEEVKLVKFINAWFSSSIDPIYTELDDQREPSKYMHITFTYKEDVYNEFYGFIEEVTRVKKQLYKTNKDPKTGEYIISHVPILGNYDSRIMNSSDGFSDESSPSTYQVSNEEVAERLIPEGEGTIEEVLNNVQKYGNENQIELASILNQIVPKEYVIKTDVDNINPGTFKPGDKQIIINPNLTNKQASKTNREDIISTILHESMHPVINPIIAQYNADPNSLPEEVRNAVKRLDILRKDAIRHSLKTNPTEFKDFLGLYMKLLKKNLDKNTNKIKNVQEIINFVLSSPTNKSINTTTSKITSEMKSKYYGLVNLEEFVAMTWSDNNFQEVLNTITATKDEAQTFLQKLIDAFENLFQTIFEAFGITVNPDNVLAHTLAESYGIITHGKEVELNKNGTQWINPAKGKIIYSGDAIGSDRAFKAAGSLYGITTKDYVPGDIDKLTDVQKEEVEQAYVKAVIYLQRAVMDLNNPDKGKAYSARLVRRDYLQAKSGDALYAIVEGFEVISDKSKKGQKIIGVNSHKVIPKGGTGYSMVMADNLGKPVYAFDQSKQQWYKYTKGTITKIDIPILTERFTGVGTRQINDVGRAAIAELFENTYPQQNNTPEQTELDFNNTSDYYSKLGNRTVSKNIELVKWNDLKEYIEPIEKDLNGVVESIVATRIPNSQKHFGNPFSHEPTGKAQGLIKTETIQEAVEKYIDWVLNNEYDFDNPDNVFLLEMPAASKLNHNEEGKFSINDKTVLVKNKNIKTALKHELVHEFINILPEAKRLELYEVSKQLSKKVEKDKFFETYKGLKQKFENFQALYRANENTPQYLEDFIQITLGLRSEFLDITNLIQSEYKKEYNEILKYVDLERIDKKVNNVIQNNKVSTELKGFHEKYTIPYLIEPERRAWIIEQLQSGKLKGKPILYYKELGEPSHATALDWLINSNDSPINKNNNTSESIKVNETITDGIDFVFEENPELANSVYEALGFEKKLPFIKSDKTIDDDFFIKDELIVTKELQNIRTNNFDGSINKELSELKAKLNTLPIGSKFNVSEYTKPVSTNLEELLSKINLSESNKVLLEKIKPLIKGVKIEYVDKFILTNSGAVYSDKYNTIRINKSEKNIPLEELLMHELLHAATFRKISYFETNTKGLSEKELLALNELESIRKVLKEASDKYWDNRTRFARSINPLEGYRVESIHEIISYAFTDKSFRDAIADIPYKGNKSILDKLVELIANIFGVKQDTILQVLLANTEVLLENNQITPQQKQQALQLYSRYLESLNKPNTNPILQGNQANIEEIITQLEKEGLLEIDCKGKLKAEKGLATSFVKGGKWKVIKDLKGYPTHKEGGVDLTIGKGGVSIKNGNTQFTAKYGLVIPKN